MIIRSDASFSALGAHWIIEEIFICKTDSVFKFCGVGPAKCLGLGYVEELSGGTVWLGGIPADLACVADYPGHLLGEFLDREFFPCTGVDGLIAAVIVHKEHTEIGKVIHI